MRNTRKNTNVGAQGFINGGNFDEDRSKSKNNIDEVKDLFENQKHTVHKQNIICRESVAKETEKRK